MKHPKLGLILWLLLPAFLASAQNEKDAGLWGEANLELDLGTGLKGFVTPQVRMDENISRVAGVFTDIGVDKKLNEFLEVNVTYRIGARRNNEYFEPRQRVSTGISGKYKWGDFGVGLSLRYQASPSAVTSDGDVDIRNIFRQKASLKYDGLKKMTLGTSMELFEDSPKSGLSAWRWQCSLEKKLSKRKSVSVGYMIQKNLYNLNMDYVFQLSYAYEFKSREAKEDKKTNLLITPSF